MSLLQRISYSLLLVIIGAVVYRARGGIEPDLPRPVDQLLFALPYAALCYKEYRSKWLFFVILALTGSALALGHGQYMDLGSVTRVTDDESLDFIVRLFWGPDDYHNYWRDFTGLCITGLVVTLPAGLSLVLISRTYLIGIIAGLSGLLKALAYSISWQTGYATEGGEYLTGALLWGTIVVLWNVGNPKN